MDSLNNLPGVGPITIKKLARLNITTTSDLLYHFPNRYIDFSHIIKINQVAENENITIIGTIIKFQNIYTRTGKNLQKATVKDTTGSLDLLWFNQSYLSQSIIIGQQYSFAGTVSLFHGHLTIITPEFGQYHTGKIIPIYPETNGLSSKWFRKTIQTFLPTLLTPIVDPLPSPILKKYQLLSQKDALFQIHLPKNSTLLNQARTRLAIDEILSLQARSHLQRLDWQKQKPATPFISSPTFNRQIDKLIKSLPYKLTASQKKVWLEIKPDLCSPLHITNRLLQGDVGSGKTIIAILSCFLTSLNNHLSLIIAPTEILAQQHFQNFKKILANFPIDIHLLTTHSHLKLDSLKTNSIIISTHAAIYQKKNLNHQVALLVIDEQHKFGVSQRSFLHDISPPPHCLTMTATPIPRSISLTLLGNLDLSIIDNPPLKRLPIKSYLVPNHKKNDCYAWIKKEIIQKKAQAFIVCPFIDLSETLSSVKAASTEFEYLSSQVFPEFKLALIHGKTKNKIAQDTISKFQKGQIDILVTTPIIEVGIDIPNSSIIVIESADRFGLAQLHQLRGRVGRGVRQSYCFFFTQSENPNALSRLKFLEDNSNGLKIAEYDLKTRGPGEAFSTIQHGFPSLKLATFFNTRLITYCQKILKDIISSSPSINLHTLISSKTDNPNSIVSN